MKADEVAGFLEKLLNYSQFTTVEIRSSFTPRKLGLGYSFVPGSSMKSVLAPVVKEARKKKREADREAERENDGKEEESSSEQVSKIDYIMKKRR